jgi:hypothetical protein
LGWGFTIENASGYLVVEATDYCVGDFATPCTIPVGTYVDLAGPAFIVVGPAPEVPEVTQEFDQAAGTAVTTTLLR